MARIFLIEDDRVMAECIARAMEIGNLHNAEDDAIHKHEIVYFSNAIAAMNELNRTIPDLIILDILLSGPDGFSFLNELVSYSDTVRIPVIVITSLDLSGSDLSHYGVRRILQKETMTPKTIQAAIDETLNDSMNGAFTYA